MEFYLIRLSYTPAAWQHLVHNTTSLDQRLEPVRRLIKHLRGSLASFHFFDTPHFQQDGKAPVVVNHKMVMFGENDLLAILAMPDKAAAQAFRMAIAAEPGLKTVDLVSIMPLEDAIAAMPLAKGAVAATGYVAPGRANP